MKSEILLALSLGLLFLYMLGRKLVVPLKFAGRVIINFLIGSFILWLINIFGNFINFKIAINPITALIAGFLGVPGVTMLFLLKILS